MTPSVTVTPNPAAEAAALFQRGDVAAARQLAERELARSETAALRHLAGVACCRMGDLKAGADHLRKAADLRPDDPGILLMLMRALIDLDCPAEALLLPFGATAIPPAALLQLWRTRAEAAHRAGEGRLEADALERSVELDPRDDQAREMLVQLLISFDRPEAALGHLDALPPSRARSRARAAALVAARRYDEATGIDRKLLDTDPADREAWLSLLLIADRRGDLDEIGRLIAVGQAAGFTEAELNYGRAVAAKRQGDLEEALRLAEASEVSGDTARPSALIASLADRLGQPGKAFDAATLAAQATPNASAWRRRAAAHRANLRRIEAAMTDDWAADWTPPPPLSRSPPVFLVGFPRSGTTLLDTFLMGHPDVLVIEEEQMLDRAAGVVGDMTQLDRVDANTLKRARQAYFAELDRVAPDAVDGKLVIDKLPLAMTGAVLIHRLFPCAKFIFARRHPADSVLSNYLQAFQLNDGMANFLDIGDAAEFFDAAMSIWQRTRELFHLDVHDVAYEDLVADQQAVLKPLVRTLGLPWRPDLLDHRKTAKDRGVIVTPSYDQVTQPVHSRAAGRWKRYAEQLAPVLPLLDPWARRLGYGPIAPA